MDLIPFSVAARLRAVLLSLLLSANCLVPLLAQRSRPVPVILDTDMGNDIDDALALALLHSLDSRGECRLEAVTITKDNPWSAPYVDLVNTFYGRAFIPIGVVKGSRITPDTSKMIEVPSKRKAPDGTLIYPHRLFSGVEAPDAVELLRRVLAANEDGSVIIVQIGFSTNLAHLLASGPDSLSPLSGRELAARKVKSLVLMGGNFARKEAEFNIKMDIPSARQLFSDWPTPIVASGYEIGESILFPASSIEHDFGYVPNHPVAEAYRLYLKFPYDRPSWDVTAALYAIRPQGGYFSLSPPGVITVDSQGNTTFSSREGGRHRYLTVDPQQRAKALDAMVLLSSEPPENSVAR